MAQQVFHWLSFCSLILGCQNQTNNAHFSIKSTLTLGGLVTPYGVNIGSGNGMLLDGTKPILDPMFSYYQIHSSEGDYSFTGSTSHIVAQWRHMMIQNWVNIGSGNGLLPHGTEPLLDQCELLSIRFWGLFPNRHVRHQFLKLAWEITVKSPI